MTTPTRPRSPPPRRSADASNKESGHGRSGREVRKPTPETKPPPGQRGRAALRSRCPSGRKHNHQMTSQSLAKIPEPVPDPARPSSQHLEGPIVGGTFVGGPVLQKQIFRLLSDDDFDDPYMRYEFSGAREMFNSGAPVDAVTFPAWVQRTRGQADQPRMALLSHLADLTANAPDAVTTMWLARDLATVSARKAVYDHGVRLMEKAGAAAFGDLRELAQTALTKVTSAVIRAERVGV